MGAGIAPYALQFPLSGYTPYGCFFPGGNLGSVHELRITFEVYMSNHPDKNVILTLILNLLPLYLSLSLFLCLTLSLSISHSPFSPCWIVGIELDV